MLDLGQVVLVKRLLASRDAVLHVGQNQGHQVPLQLVTDDVQVSQICGAHFVAAGRNKLSAKGHHGSIFFFFYFDIFSCCNLLISDTISVNQIHKCVAECLRRSHSHTVLSQPNKWEKCGKSAPTWSPLQCVYPHSRPGRCAGRWGSWRGL